MPDTSLLMDGALAVTGLVFVAAFGLVWRVNVKVGELYTVLCHPENGVVTMLKTLTETVNETVTRVAVLEKSMEHVEAQVDRLHRA